MANSPQINLTQHSSDAGLRHTAQLTLTRKRVDGPYNILDMAEGPNYMVHLVLEVALHKSNPMVAHSGIRSAASPARSASSCPSMCWLQESAFPECDQCKTPSMHICVYIYMYMGMHMYTCMHRKYICIQMYYMYI